ncbi:leucine rich repeat LRR-containing protein [Nitzschia inconspicua]|uniref:Leucine rich repeat LRR-containing protein n=1 Tax=Nitzschia inconspicua TaxID=303405 RepID=A0A9K3Q607_9STRA|nr:leucine rich repeat LRR-containing protein [Nitzschia inconspicua]
MTSLQSRMAAFKKAAGPSSPRNSNKSRAPASPRKFPALFKKKVSSPQSSPVKPSSSKPKVGKLSKSKTNVVAGIFNRSASASTAPGSSKSGNVSISRASAPFNKENLTAGSIATEKEQAQKCMSDKAKGALVAPKASDKQDWDYLYQLALQYDQLKAQGVEETKNPTSMPQSEARQKTPTKRHESGDKENIKSSLEGLIGGSNFTASGNFLDKSYFDQYLVENKKFGALTFDFSGQGKLFKRFDRKDEEQRNISKKFVEELLKHPRSKDITILNMSNAMLPDTFLMALSEQCLAKNGLPKLQVLNLESNLLGQDGLIALSKTIAHPNVWRYLQILKLENQKMQFTSNAEEALGEAVLQSPSLVVVSLRVRGGLERQQINNTVATNIDNLRQARREHGSKTGTLKERKRNEMELYFDSIAANADKSITEVDLTGNLKFLGLNATERTKTGAAFGTNATVKCLKMVKLKLDDNFAEAFGKALATNTTLEKVCLDSNDISGAGIKALLEGLGKNTSIVDFQVRHQSKTLASSDEEALPGLIYENKSVIKLGVDVRNQLIKTQLEKKCNENREWQRKQRLANKK